MLMGHIVENIFFFLKRTIITSNSVIFSAAKVTGCVQYLFTGFFLALFVHLDSQKCKQSRKKINGLYILIFFMFD